MSTQTQLDWTELDDRAVDTVRVLADGRRAEGRQRSPRHRDEPGARGLPALPEGDAARPRRPALAGPRPLRALVRPLQPHAVHPALPRGYGLELDDLKACAPGAARPRATPSTTTPPASRSPPARSARASATRSAWRWRPAASAACSTPTPPPGECAVRPPHLRRSRSDGDLQEGVSGEASSHRRHPAARQPDPDLRRQPASRSRTTPTSRSARTSAKRYEAYGWHVQTVDWTNGGDGVRRGRPGAVRRDRRRPRRSPTSRASSCCARSSPGRHPTPRTPARRTARRSATTRSRPPRRSSASTPTRPSRSPTRSRAHPDRVDARQGRRRPPGRREFEAWATQPRRRPRCSTGCRPAPCPTGWDDGLPTFPADAKGVATRKASGERDQRDRPTAARAVGRLGRPRRSPTTRRSRARRRSSRGALHQDVEGRPVRPGAALRHPRARHGRDPQRHRPARRHPRLTAAPSSCSPTTCAPRSGWPR